jgi:hypothetical protein
LTSGADGTRTRENPENAEDSAGSTAATVPEAAANPAKLGARSIESDHEVAPDAVEAALAEAVARAAAAGAWDVVGKLAGELEARRRARQAPGVVDLEAERRRRS